MAIPTTLAPFFQEYDLAVLDPQSAAPLIFERTLQYGDRKELHWLFSQYPRQQIRDWVREFGKERLPHPHLDFWQIVLEIESWGNLVYLARDVRVGFSGYGYEIVMPLVETQEARLASVEDIALMKLDALLARAARKDFYDLYFICQKIPLRRILDLAPRKYPSVRDFEAQTVKRLVYFQNAETDPDLQLLASVSWQRVKDYFTQTSKQIADEWLA